MLILLLVSSSINTDNTNKGYHHALTHTAINKLSPSSKSIESKRPYKHSDGNGLQLWVRYTGVKSWISGYRWQGKQQTLTIGTYPAMSLQDVRNLEIKRLVADGINPKEDKRKTQVDNDGSKSFDVLAQRWHEDRKAQPRLFAIPTRYCCNTY